MQVDVLSSQVSALEDEAKTVKQLEKSLKKSQAEKVDLDQKLFAANSENSSIQDQVTGPCCCARDHCATAGLGTVRLPVPSNKHYSAELCVLNSSFVFACE